MFFLEALPLGISVVTVSN